MLYHDPTSIDVIGQVVTKRDWIGKREVAVRNNNLVLLQYSQIRRPHLPIEEVNRYHIGFSLDLRLKLTGQTVIRIDDEHVELTTSRCRCWGGCWSWRGRR